MNPITCPNCGKKLEISHALKLQIEKDIVAREKEKFDEELKSALEKAQETSFKKVREQFELQLKRTTEEANAKDEQNKKLIEELTQLTVQLREAKEEKREARLEMEKKLLEEEEKIRNLAQKKAEEENHLKIIEKDKQLISALKELEDMRRKLQQGSQQTQGEAFELDFEERLKTEFPNDKISEVLKGMRGADLMQEVWDRNNNKCGLILWELKNTKSWSEQWIDKLKIDQREVTADYAVIVSEALPSKVETAKYHKNVWITKRNFVIGLACALRMNLIQIAMVRRSNEGKKEKTDLLYSYLSGTEFRLRVEAIIEAFTNMQIEIEKEKRYFANKWARDEKNIRAVIDNTYGMHGDLKGIVGSALPQIKGLNGESEDQLRLSE
ncbi:DUF2130 domain-containing protein [Candidatus Roizmanbacteria bacterium]|nr:DUF2130 domain-containing protein [Candidatus Roizmanbacteria bacterium]